MRKDRAIEIVRIFLFGKEDDVKREIKRSFPAAKQGSINGIKSLSESISLYLNGRKVVFDRHPLCELRMSHFQRVVYRAVQRIPYGRVATYKTIAQHSATRSARAVGNALARNPFPILIPCHRVINSHRYLGGFQAGEDLKRTLLLIEKVPFEGYRRVATRSLIDA